MKAILFLLLATACAQVKTDDAPITDGRAMLINPMCLLICVGTPRDERPDPRPK